MKRFYCTKMYFPKEKIQAIEKPIHSSHRPETKGYKIIKFIIIKQSQDLPRWQYKLYNYY